MGQLAGPAVRAEVQPAIDDHAAADAGPEHEARRRRCPAAAPIRDSASVNALASLMIDTGRSRASPQRLDHGLAPPRPRKVGEQLDRPGIGVERAGHADAASVDGSPSVDRRVPGAGQSLDDRCRPVAGAGLGRVTSDDDRLAVGLDDDRLDVRSAEIETEPPHVRTGGLAGRR